MKEKNPTREKLLDITFEEIYIHGYAGTSIGSILKKASIPKGSMYHFFNSKKALVLAMIQERLFPKMDLFFNYKKEKEQSVFSSLKDTFVTMSKHKNLITYGCPFYRLMVELSPIDKDFDALLMGKYNELLLGLETLFQEGINNHEFNESLNVKHFSEFYLSSVWGVLSLSPSLSSPKNFITHIRYILNTLESYKIK